MDVRGRVVWGVVALHVVRAVAAVAAPASSAHTWLTVAAVLATLVLATIALMQRRPRAIRSWAALVAVLWVTGVVSVVGEIARRDLGAPLGIAGVLALVVSAIVQWRFVRRASGRRRDVDGVIDGIVLALVAGSIGLAYLLDPSSAFVTRFVGGELGGTARVAIALPLAVVPAFLLSLSARLAFLHPTVTSARHLLVANTCMLVATVTDAAGTAPRVADVLFGLIYLASALAIAHPDVDRLHDEVAGVDRKLSIAQMAVLGSALIVMRTATLVVDGPWVAVLGLPVTALVVWRLLRLVRDRTRAEQQATDSLAEASARAEQQAVVASLGELAVSELDDDPLRARIEERVAESLRLEGSEVLLHLDDAPTPAGDLVVQLPGLPQGYAIVVRTGTRIAIDDRDRDFLRSVAAVVGGGLRWRHLHRQADEHAHRDPLTGLLNRAGLDRGMAALPAASAPYGVLFCDLDGFKALNDRHGHDAGDRALVEVARRLTAATRESDLVARPAGDEFVIVSRGVDPAQLSALAARVATATSDPLDLGWGTEHVGISVGRAHAPAGTEPATALARADAAMYEVKRARRRAAAPTA